ncbi:MAG: hypothetical protein AAB288_07465, partial [Acidobacteriota bacterium]
PVVVPVVPQGQAPNYRLAAETVAAAHRFYRLLAIGVLVLLVAFGLPYDRLDVVCHPQSVVHSMVEMVDGSIIAQLGVTDMRHAIQYALTYPERKENSTGALDMAKLSQLSFEEPDLEKFPCLSLAYTALRAGGTAPTALNAANEIAVQAFLDGKIGLAQIAQINDSVMGEHISKSASSLENVLEANEWARTRAIMMLGKTAAAN